MKKVFSLILAVVMVASLASVAFAADYITSENAKNVPAAVGYYSKLQKVSSKLFNGVDGDVLVFGTEYYYPLMMQDGNGGYDTAFISTSSQTDVYRTVNANYAKEVGSLKVSAEWTEGAEFIESVSIKPVFVYSDTNGGEINRNVYCIAVKTCGESEDVENIVGKIKVTGTPGAGSFKRANAVETTISFDQRIGYDTCAVVETATPSTIGSGKYTFANKTLNLTSTGSTDTISKVDTSAEAGIKEFKFNGDITATLDGVADKSFRISFNSLENAEIIAANPDAAIMFYNIECNFRETAEVVIDPIDAEGTNYLYQILPSGTTKNLTDTYSVDDEQFTFTARKLTGSYIVSDMPLVF